MNSGVTSVFVWGMFKDTTYAEPTQVKQLSKCSITKVASGGFFYLAANSQGELYGWGQTKNCRFGVKQGDFFMKPIQIGIKAKVKQISAGNWHSLVSDFDGNLYGVGHNKYGSLGLNNFENVSQFVKAPISFKIYKISSGDGFSIVISAQNKMYGAGHSNYHGHKTKQNINSFKQICPEEQFSTVSCGFTHSLATNTRGQTYSWGDGEYFQLGHGNKNHVQTPKMITALTQVNIVNTSCTRGEKYSHSMAVSDKGEVYTWGCGYKGKLGHFSEWTHADSADEPLPKLMQSQKQITNVIAGGIHSGIITQSGEILTFGCGSDGRLGHVQSNQYRYLYREGFPRKIQSLNGFKIIDAKFSYYHNICVAVNCKKYQQKQ